MGRRMLKMERIANEKSRMTTYRKRKQCLFKKAWEFSTLCGVDACVIVYGPNSTPSGPEVWPEDPNKVKEIINRYKITSTSSSRKTFQLFDFFANKRKSIENKIEKSKQATRGAKYRVWDERLEKLSGDQLWMLMVQLEGKMQAAAKQKSALEADRKMRSKTIAEALQALQPATQQSICAYDNGMEYKPQGVEQQLLPLPPAYQPPMPFHWPQEHEQPLNLNLTETAEAMMMLRGNNGINQFPGIFAGSEIQYSHLMKGPVYPYWTQGNVMYNPYLSYYPMDPTAGQTLSQMNELEDSTKNIR